MTRDRIGAILKVGILIAAVLQAGSAWSDPLADGQAAFARNAYDEAYRLLLPLAEKGNPEAQLKVGFMLFYGLGVKQDYSSSFRFTLPAAKTGNTTAQHLVCKMYRYGWGTPADPSQSFSWCRKAADQGLPDAIACLGEYYAQGIGTNKDATLAADALFKAGMAFLKEGRRDMALATVEKIRVLVSPDHFLAYRLLDEIYDEETGSPDRSGAGGAR